MQPKGSLKIKRKISESEKERMVLEYLKLFVTFAKIGMFTIGGGYAMIPLIEREIVAKQWMSKEEFMEMFALTQSLPGGGGEYFYLRRI